MKQNAYFWRFRLDRSKTCIIVHLLDQANQETSGWPNGWRRSRPRRRREIHRFSDRSVALPALEAGCRGRRRDADHGRRREWRAVRGLSAQTEFLRSRRRHRTRGCGAAAALRASRREGRCWCARARTACSAPAPTSACWRARPTPTRSTSANSPTRPATAWRILSENSGQRFVSVVNGTAAGGGYELALATDHIILADDGSAAVSLPEVPLLAVLPGTGGLTRVVDKRKVRRDHADYFCTIEEGIKGKRAVQWRLVDEIVPNSKLEAKVAERAKEFAAASKRNGNGKGIALTPLTRTIDDRRHPLRFCQRRYRPRARIATISIKAPEARAAGRYRRHDRRRAPRSGRCRWRANSMTPSCICASTNSKPRCWCSSRMASAPMCWPATPSSKPTRRTGWSTRSGNTGSGC